MREIIALGIFCLMLASCSIEPEPILYGKDNCGHCKMTIIDNKYGAELVTETGKVFKFDALECMIDHLYENPDLNTAEALILTVDIAHPGKLIDARKASFLKDKAFRSPMGANLASFSMKHLAEHNRQTPDAKILTWEELLKSWQIKYALR